MEEPATAWSVGGSGTTQRAGNHGNRAWWGPSGDRPAFIGRGTELESLHRLLADATAGRGRLVTLTGEAGIGKTRLADELCSTAAADGAVALWARSWEGGGAPAYWLWAELLRAFKATSGDEPVDLSPDALRHVEQLADPARMRNDDEQARFSLFDAVTRYLRAAAAPSPIVIVIDDVQWADEPSLQLLHFFARELRSSRILCVLTARSDVGATEAAPVLAELAKEGRTIDLAGLSRAEVRDYVGSLVGGNVSIGVRTSDAIFEATDGNPFFVGEIVRLMVTEGSIAGDAGRVSFSIPQNVRETIERRFAPLGDATKQVLEVAAVIGDSFDRELLCDAYGEGRSLVEDALTEAAAANVVRPTQDGGAFAHGLLRETLFATMSAERRIALHLAIAAAVERRSPGEVEALAYHYFEAREYAPPGRALALLTDAAGLAMGRLAFGEAAFHIERALGVVGTAPDASLARCDLLIQLGDALKRSRDVAGSTTALMQAAAIARELGDAERFALCALAYPPDAEIVWVSDLADATQVDLLEEALALLTAPTSLRARLLASLALSLYWVDPSGDRAGSWDASSARREQLVTDAVTIARTSGDESALAFALTARLHALWGPDEPEGRTAITDELLQIARRTRDRDAELYAKMSRVIDLLDEWDLPGVDREIASLERMALSLRHPIFVWTATRWRAMRAIIAGRLDEAELLAGEAFSAGERAIGDASFNFYGVQLGYIRYYQGRVAELEPAVRMAADQQPDVPAWRATLALCLADLGRLDEAGRELDALAADDFVAIPRDLNWISGLVIVARACAALGATEHARTVYELLRPYAQRVGTSAGASATPGPVDGPLALLAATMGDDDAALAHLEAVTHRLERAPAPVIMADTQLEVGAQLLARRPDHARTLIAAALTTFETLGIDPPAERARALLTGLGAGGRPASQQRPAARGTAYGLELAGDYWTVSSPAGGFRIIDLKGLHYLAELLRRPGTEVHVLDLIAVAHGTAERRAALDEDVRPSRATSQPLIDDVARTAYRSRLDELREQLAEAESWGDIERASAAREELQAIEDELSETIGVGGRPRTMITDAERARVNITKLVRSAIRRIGEVDPELGHHLATSVRTGAFCSYDPGPGSTITWRF